MKKKYVNERIRIVEDDPSNLYLLTNSELVEVLERHIQLGVLSKDSLIPVIYNTSKSYAVVDTDSIPSILLDHLEDFKVENVLNDLRKMAKTDSYNISVGLGSCNYKSFSITKLQLNDSDIAKALDECTHLVPFDLCCGCPLHSFSHNAECKLMWQDKDGRYLCKCAN